MAYIGSAYMNVVPKFPGLAAAVRAEFEKLNGSAYGERVGAGFGSGVSAGIAKTGAIAGAFSSITNAAINSITSSVGAAVSRFDALNQYPKTMELLGYSAEEADASIAKMSDRLQSLPTTLDSMTSSVQGIVAITGDLPQATDAALALNDMLVASGSNMQLVTAATEQFRQMLAKGKPEMEDWKSLTAAMPGQMKQLAQEMLGAEASANDLYYALGGGGAEATISTNELLEAMIRLDTEGGAGITSFKEQAETAAGGVSTSISNMQNAVTRGIAGTLDAIGKDRIAGAFDGAKELINDAFSAFNGFVSAVVPMASGIAEAIGESAPQIATFAASFLAFRTAGTHIASFAGNLRKARTEAGLLSKVNTVLGTSLSPVSLGIGLAATAAGLLVSAFMDAKQKSENFEKATRGVSDAVADTVSLDGYSGRIADVGDESAKAALSVEDLAEKIAESADAMQSVADEARNQTTEHNTALGVIDESVGKADMSAEAQGRLEWALRLVNEQFGLTLSQADVVNGFYTDAEGNVANLRDTIYDLIEAKKLEIKTNALTENLSTAYENESEAAETYADARKKYADEYARQLSDYTTIHGMLEDDARAFLDEDSKMWTSYREMEDAGEIYREAVSNVSDLEAALGDASTSASEAASELDRWGNSVSKLFEKTVNAATGSENGLGMLKEDLASLGVDVEDLKEKSDDELQLIADAYDGTALSIIDALESLGIGMDEAARSAVRDAEDIADALAGMEGVSESLGNVGVNVTDFALSLAAAGVSTEQLKEVGAENLSALAEAFAGNVGAMIWWIENYNSTPLLDKEGNVQVDYAELVDANGNVYTWNGTELVDKSGQAVADDVVLLDALGNVYEWNAAELEWKFAEAEADGNAIDGTAREAVNDTARAISGLSGKSVSVNAYGNYDYAASAIQNLKSRIDTLSSKTVTIAANVISSVLSGNAAGGIRLNAEGGYRAHADGAVIAHRPVPLDIVGEDGAEAIVPLTNRRYSQPFIDLLAEGIADKGVGSKVENNYNLTIDGIDVAGRERIWQIVMQLFAVMRREGAM